MEQKIVKFPKGIFTISIDYESGWGRPEKPFLPEEKRIVRDETRIAGRLLDLFEEFRMPATWAVVSHLLDPTQADTHDALWFDADHIIARIAASLVKHEIGSHSYAHIVYGDADREAVLADIRNAKSIHAASGLPFETFVFPRNCEGFHALLKEAGVKRYRGTTLRWYSGFPGSLKRAARFLEYFLPTAPPAVMPFLHPSGLLEIPDSMLFLGRDGIRKFLPSGWLLRKAIQGLQRAVSEKRIFHLWFHPPNFSYDTEKQFGVLTKILREAQKLRKEGKLDVLTMADIHRHA